MNEKHISDAVVNFDNAKPWVEVLYREDPTVVIDRAMEAEPAVMALAAHVAARVEAKLLRRRVPKRIAQFVSRQICYAGGLSIELLRRGNAELWRDMIEPTDDNEKGTTDEQSH
jgi:hypothetical protein